jgi:putative phosphoribosyl transferase
VTAVAERDVDISARQGIVLPGIFATPDGYSGSVVFAHGSGSSRHSPRNRQVAALLQQRGIATLLMDLLTTGEEAADATTRAYRFDIALLAERLDAAIGWLVSQPFGGKRPVGLFGASTGAAAALVAAAGQPGTIRAVVSRGGRPDLAGSALGRVQAATLLIVGGRDEVVLELNREAYEQLPGAKEMQVVEGATHLFEEPGAMDKVARLAGDWFVRHFAGTPPRSASHSV